MIKKILIKALLLAIPSLGGPLATALVTIIVALGEAEAKIMVPVIEANIARADLMPGFKHGYEKFVWVFTQTVKEFPDANSRGIGTLINILVQAKL